MQPSIHGYTIGATNALFKAKSGLADVLIEIDEDRLEISGNELRWVELCTFYPMIVVLCRPIPW